jgi:hypothetical protein
MKNVKNVKKKAALPSRPVTSSIRLTEEDWELIEKLQAATGLRKWAEVMRQGLLALAKKHGII